MCQPSAPVWFSDQMTAFSRQLSASQSVRIRTSAGSTWVCHQSHNIWSAPCCKTDCAISLLDKLLYPSSVFSLWTQVFASWALKEKPVRPWPGCCWWLLALDLGHRSFNGGLFRCLQQCRVSPAYFFFIVHVCMSFHYLANLWVASLMGTDLTMRC